MRCAFFTNYLSIHTSPLFDELCDLGLSVTCVESGETSKERETIGDSYSENNVKRIRLSEYILLKREFNQFDFCIFSDFENISKIRRNTVCSHWFFMSEHFFKNKRLRNFLSFIKIKFFIAKYFKADNKYALCNSYYSGKEYKKLGFNNSSIFKFGYFPELCDKSSSLEKDHNTILWSGRFLKWKHPEYALIALRILERKNENYRLTFVGDGPLKEKIKYLVEKENLQQKVTFTGFMKHEDLMKTMESSDVYIFSSDKNEGWGVVLNEALFSKCITFASKKAGSTPYLNNGQNMIVFKTKKQFVNAIKLYGNNETEYKKIPGEARKTIDLEWNYKNAARRIKEFVESMLLNKNVKLPLNGPLSLHYKK